MNLPQNGTIGFDPQPYELPLGGTVDPGSFYLSWPVALSCFGEVASTHLLEQPTPGPCLKETERRWLKEWDQVFPPVLLLLQC